MNALSYLHTDMQVKAVDQMQRVISGFAAYHTNRDRVQDIIDPSASVKAVSRLDPKRVGVFIGHKTDSLPMGIPLVIEARPEGLYTETLIKPGPSGDDLLATAAFLQQHGSPLGMSIGYRCRDSKMERNSLGITRRILDYDLAEYSYAANQSIANPLALTTGVKQTDGDPDVAEDATEGQYTVALQGDGWQVCRGDGAVVGSYPDQVTAEAVAAALRAEAAADEAEDMAEGEGKAVLSTADANSLPDSAFLYIEPGGAKDSSGRTVPRSKRHLPYKNAQGDIDLPHLRNAIARIPQMTGVSDALKARLQARARRLLASADGGKTAPLGGTMTDLPDSSYLVIAPGGVLDDEAKTTPRSLRQLCIHDAEGKLDATVLRATLADLPTVAVGAQQRMELEAKVYRLLAHAEAGATDDPDGPEWGQGAALQVYGLGVKLTALADAMAEELAAMQRLGQDTKAGARMQGPMREKLRAAMKAMSDILAWADMAEEGTLDSGKLALYQRRLDLAALTA